MKNKIPFFYHQLLIAGCLSLFLINTSSGASWNWARSANSPSLNQPENQVGRAVDRDHRGNIYVTGSISGETTFSATLKLNADVNSKDFFVTKYDANGNALWAFKASSVGDDEGLSIKCFRDSIYVVGYVSGSGKIFGKNGGIAFQTKGKRDILIAKYASSGELIWANISGGSLNDQGVDIDVDKKSGRILVAGEGRGSLTFGFNNLVVPSQNILRAAFVSVFDKDGNTLWAQRIEGSQDSFAGGAVFSAGEEGPGNIFVGGNYRGNLAVDGQILASSVQSTDGIDPQVKFTQDIFGLLLSSNGQLIWHKESEEGFSMEEVKAVAKDSFGNFYLAGRYYPMGQNWEVVGDFGFGGKFLNLAQVSQVGGFCLSLDSQGEGRWINSVYVRQDQGFTVNNQLLQYLDMGDYKFEDMSFNDLQVNAQNEVYVVGSFTRVARYDDLLDIVFDLVSGNGGTEPDGFVLVFDGTQANGDFLTGSPFGQLPLNGELFTQRDVAWGVAVHPTSGEAYLTGETYSQVCHFGPFLNVQNTSWNTQPTGDADLFLAKFIK